MPENRPCSLAEVGYNSADQGSGQDLRALKDSIWNERHLYELYRCGRGETNSGEALGAGRGADIRRASG